MFPSANMFQPFNPGYNPGGFQAQRPGFMPFPPPFPFPQPQQNSMNIISLLNLLKYGQASGVVNTLGTDLGKLTDLAAGGDVITRSNALLAALKNVVSAEQTQLAANRLTEIGPMLGLNGGGGFGGGSSGIEMIFLLSALGGSSGLGSIF